MKRLSFCGCLLLSAAVFGNGCQQGSLRGSADCAYRVHCVFIAGYLSDYAASNPLADNIVDKQGNPLLSWRVALLQYGDMTSRTLYKKFRLDEPWNSPHNLAVAKDIPETYADPWGSTFTPYLAVAGEKGAFRPRNPRAWKSLAPNCAVIVTVRDSDVFWTEPRDISPEEAGKGDRLYWARSRTMYVNGALRAACWHRTDPKLPKPTFEYEPEPPPTPG
jgi:hypothetical protein